VSTEWEFPACSIGYDFLMVGKLREAGGMSGRWPDLDAPIHIVYYTIACNDEHWSDSFTFRSCEATSLGNKWGEYGISDSRLESLSPAHIRCGLAGPSRYLRANSHWCARYREAQTLWGSSKLGSFRLGKAGGHLK
jgi:hypothetical protein